MTEKRIIKKYPNRRLYDTAVSSYITLQEIRQMVIECVDFQVIDAKTEEDLTHSTLLQIILEQEEKHAPLFSREILEHFIRSYNDSMQSMMGNYLQQSTNFFIEQQNKLKQGFDALLDANPLNYFNEIANQNMHLWQSLQERFQQSTSTGDGNENTQAQDKK